MRGWRRTLITRSPYNTRTIAGCIRSTACRHLHRKLRISAGYRIALSVLTLLVVSGLPGNAQPGWVRDAMANPRLRSSGSETGAEVLLDERTFDMRGNDIVIENRRRITRILGVAGKHSGGLTESVSPNRELKGLEGWLIRNGEVVATLSEDDAVTVNLSDREILDEQMGLVASFVDVRAGDVVAFESEVKEVDWTAYYQEIPLQFEDPVCSLRVEVTVPDGWTVLAEGWRTEAVELRREESRYVWFAHDLAAQPTEDLMPPWVFLTRRLFVVASANEETDETQFRDWDAVVAWGERLTTGKDVPGDAIRSVVAEITRTVPTPPEVVRAVSSYVQKSIRYVGIELEKGRWEPHACDLTFANKYGDCKDKVMLMKAMLAAAGIPSTPVFLSTRFPVLEDLPSPFQFNHVIIALPARLFPDLTHVGPAWSGSWVFFDPTNEDVPFGELSPSIQGASVLVHDSGSAAIVHLPYERSDENRNSHRADIRLRPDGSYDGTAEISISGSSFHERARAMAEMPEQKRIETLRHDLSPQFASAAIRDLTVSAAESLVIRFHLSGTNLLQSAGAMQLLRPNPFAAGEIPILPDKPRVHPIEFGGPVLLTYSIRWHLDPALEYGGKDQQTVCNASSASVRGSLSATGNVLECIQRMSFEGGLLQPEEYAKARRFSECLNDLTGESVILTIARTREKR